MICAKCTNRGEKRYENEHEELYFITAILAIISGILIFTVVARPASADRLELEALPEENNLPIPENSEEQNDDIQWRIDFGNDEIIMLSKTDIGDLIYQGEIVTTSTVDMNGNQQIEKTCEDIPEMSLSYEVDSDVEEEGGITLLLNNEDCSIEVSHIHRNIIEFSEASSYLNSSTRELKFDNRFDARSHLISMFSDWKYNSHDISANRKSNQSSRSSHLSATLKGAKDFGFVLSPRLNYTGCMMSARSRLQTIQDTAMLILLLLDLE